jgi:hypothetical protein
MKLYGAQHKTPLALDELTSGKVFMRFRPCAPRLKAICVKCDKDLKPNFTGQADDGSFLLNFECHDAREVISITRKEIEDHAKRGYGFLAEIFK